MAVSGFFTSCATVAKNFVWKPLTSASLRA